MKILGHMHTFNDEEVIDRSLRALLDQTRPLDELLIVDNQSTDGTLNRHFPPQVSVVRHPENRGTSGAVITGFQYALAKGYDWVWVFDADSAPQPDALETLLAFFSSLLPAKQETVQILSSLAVDSTDSKRPFAIIFTPTGYAPVTYDRESDAYECNASIWSGCLFRVEAIRRVGLPSANYVLDWGEFEYGYQGMIRGYRSYVIPSSIFHHNIGAKSPSHLRTAQFGPLSFSITELSPIRLYYLIRNGIYFWSHTFRTPHRHVSVRLLMGFGWIPKYMIKLFFLQRWTELRACLRGVWDGICQNMHHRY